MNKRVASLQHIIMFLNYRVFFKVKFSLLPPLLIMLMLKTFSMFHRVQKLLIHNYCHIKTCYGTIDVKFIFTLVIVRFVNLRLKFLKSLHVQLWL